MTALFTLDQLAGMCDVSVRTVESWIAAGELAAISVSRNKNSRKPRVRVTEAALEKFLAGRNLGTAAGETPSRRPRIRRPAIPTYI